MFEQHSCNMEPTESYIRFSLALLFTYLSISYSSVILAFVGLFFLITAYKKFCFLYYILKINKKLSIQNYYLSLLPKHNSSEVFIFDISGKIIFANGAAEHKLIDINSIEDIGIDNYNDIIKNALTNSIYFKHRDKNYKAEVVGIDKENILLVYLTDITEVIELNKAIEETQKEIIYAMGEIGETRSKETGNHVKRVALYSKELALLYGLPEEEAQKLQMASPMHDIGKVGIPDAILNAPRKLTQEEFEIMKTHASLGYDMLKNSNKSILQAAAIVAHEHHEKYDGNGYPNATTKEDIHIYGRITAIADVFDALGSNRVYKKAWLLKDILELFKQERGRHFDPHLIDLFFENIDIFLDIRDKHQDVA